MMFDLLGYHSREDKPAWWAHSRGSSAADEQLRDEDAGGDR